jgi:probable phosphoglycerate mutase
MADLSLDDLLKAIASLDPEQRRELFSRLGVTPMPSAAQRQAVLLAEFSANTLKGAPDYVVMFDGGSEGNPGRGYGSYAIMTGKRREIRRLNFGDDMTNNEAEYATLMHALDDLQGRIEREARLPEEFSVEVQGDSTLVLKQVAGEWKAKDQRMRELRDSVRRSLGRFKANRLTALPREKIVEMFGH